MQNDVKIRQILTQVEPPVSTDDFLQRCLAHQHEPQKTPIQEERLWGYLWPRFGVALGGCCASLLVCLQLISPMLATQLEQVTLSMAYAEQSAWLYLL